MNRAARVRLMSKTKKHIGFANINSEGNPLGPESGFNRETKRSIVPSKYSKGTRGYSGSYNENAIRSYFPKKPRAEPLTEEEILEALYSTQNEKYEAYRSGENKCSNARPWTKDFYSCFGVPYNNTKPAQNRAAKLHEELYGKGTSGGSHKRNKKTRKNRK
jgi:hypothetical protein